MSRYVRCLLSISILFLGASSASAEPQSIGGKPTEIPEPAGFVRASAMAPGFLRTVRDGVPPGLEVVNAWVHPDDVDKLLAVSGVRVREWFTLQTFTELKGRAVSVAEFGRGRDEMERAITAGAAAFRATPRFFRRESWGTFYSSQMTDGEQEHGRDRIFVAACAPMIVAERIIQLCAHRQFLDDPDAAQSAVETAVELWADAVRAANGEGSGMDEVGDLTAIGAFIGGLAGLLGYFLYSATRKAALRPYRLRR